MRATRSTSMGFGMVNIPVKLYKITESKTLEKNIHQVHAECGSRINMPKWCATCDRKVEPSELIKGYYYDKDNYVALTDEDYDRLPLSSLKSIEIDAFITPIEDRRWFNGDIYGVAPDEIGAKAFVLFMKAMTELNVWGIAKMASREKEQLICIMPSGDGILYLQSLHWGNEIREYGELVPYADVSDKEMEMGKQLVTAMSKPVDLSSYTNEYADALKDVIEAKLEGRELEPVAPRAEAPSGADLADQLMASLAVVGSK